MIINKKTVNSCWITIDRYFDKPVKEGRLSGVIYPNLIRYKVSGEWHRLYGPTEVRNVVPKGYWDINGITLNDFKCKDYYL